MGYDETLASKIHHLLQAIGPCDRNGMFGAVVFTVNGNIAAGVEDANVFIRVGEAHAAELLKIPGIKPWVQEGKTQRAWILVTSNAVTPTVVLRERLGWAYQATAALPPKERPRPAVPVPAAAPQPAVVAPPPRAASPKRSSARQQAAAAPPLPVTAVIAPGMQRPLAPPSRFPYNPEAARQAPPPLVSKAATAPPVHAPEVTQRGRLEVGLPVTLPAKRGAAETKPSKSKAEDAPKRPPKAARAKSAAKSGSKAVRKSGKSRTAARGTSKKTSKKK